MLVAAAVAAVRRRAAYEWSAGGLRTGRLDRLRSPNLIATPRDFRPTRVERGRAILGGRMELAGAVLDMGEGGDPWDRASPTRCFAAELHSYAWLPDLLASGEAGSREALRLFLEWRRLFYRANRFVWSEAVAERRLFNLACGAKRMAAVASDAEAAVLFNALLHHARYLSGLDEGPARAAERACVPALAAAALNGRVAEKLTAQWTAKLSRVLPDTVLPDGGLKSRSPQAALELLFDLMTLDDVLLQRGRDTPVALTRAIDRLGSALRFFTLADGRLASFHGGGMGDADRIRAATSQDEEEEQPFGHAPHSGYHRLTGPTLQVILDAAPPAAGSWGVAACAQPLALEAVCGRDRIFSNSGWSPDAAGPQGLRLTAAGCTAELGGRSAGRPLTGPLARALGPRLVEGARTVKARRDENEAGAWLELSHDGWARPLGLIHERRVYVASQTDELRGEDVFSSAKGGGRRRRTAFAVRFHVDADVQVSIARDGRSVLLRGASSRGWWFRNDAAEVALEPSVQFQDGLPRRTVQVVLRGEAPAAGPARIRWKLTAVEPSPPSAGRTRPRSARRDGGLSEATQPADLPLEEELIPEEEAEPPPAQKDIEPPREEPEGVEAERAELGEE